jgi:hypothetical protein
MEIKKENPHYTLVQKLDPIRSKMSGVMAVVVGFVLGTTFIEPAITEIAVTSDGFVLARPEGGEGAPHFLGRYPELLRSWSRLIATAGLTAPEFMEAPALFAAKIGFFGPDIA